MTRDPYLTNTIGVLQTTSIIDANYLEGMRSLLMFFNTEITMKLVKYNYKVLFDGSIKSVNYLLDKQTNPWGQGLSKQSQE